MSERKLYQELASLIEARLNCLKANNTEWKGKHEERLTYLAKNCLPSGSGIDCGTKIDLDSSTGEKIVLVCEFHHMDDNGMYDGWTYHLVTVRASLTSGIDLTISGRNRNEIKDYLHEVYYWALCELTPVETAV